MQTQRVFESLGLSGDEETTYLRILRLGGSSLTAISRATGLSSNRVRPILQALEEKGLITRTLERAPTFYATPPETAVEVLILRRREEMERARLAATQLGRETRTRSDSFDPLQLVEALTGGEAADQRFRQLQRGAQGEICAFSMPPYVSPVENLDELEALDRGVAYRIIYDPAAFEVTGALDSIQRSTTAGEEARVLPTLPMKLILIDQQVALMPLSAEESSATATLVIHRSAIVAALSMLFELLWKQAVPFADTGGGKVIVEPEDELTDRDQRLITLLAAGLKDAAIARQLGHDPRTVRRYVSGLMGQLGASTRFQAGLQIAKRGWI